MTANLSLAAHDVREPDTVSGCSRLFYFYDVAEEIDLPVLRTILAASSTLLKAAAGGTPPCVPFEITPVVELMEPLLTEGGGRWDVRLKYHAHGVITVELERAFELAWSSLASFHALWTSNIRLDRRVKEIMSACQERIRVALRKPYDRVLSERYAVVEVLPDGPQPGGPEFAHKLIQTRGASLAQMIRGETTELSEEERAHILQFRMSYQPTDVVVVGSETAVVSDTPSGAGPTLEILEYANIQLLELKHYDEVLTKLLADVYHSLETRTGFLARWRLARAAERLGMMRLDVRELTEHIDNSKKFLSDSYSARLYRMIAGRLGVPEYRRLVDDKLRTAADLYRFMMDRFHQGSAFVLELMIVIILIVDLVYLFWPRA